MKKYNNFATLCLLLLPALIVALFTSGCAEYPNVVRVCVNYLEPNSYCGTGFFTESDALLTAQHVTDLTDDNILTAIGPGTNETSHQMSTVALEVTQAEFDSDVTDSPVPVCDSIPAEAHVVMLGVTSNAAPHEITQVPGKLIGASKDFIYITGVIPSGFSGGPVVLQARAGRKGKCVIGVIQGTIGTIVVATDITAQGIMGSIVRATDITTQTAQQLLAPRPPQAH